LGGDIYADGRQLQDIRHPNAPQTAQQGRHKSEVLQQFTSTTCSTTIRTQEFHHSETIYNS